MRLFKTFVYSAGWGVWFVGTLAVSVHPSPLGAWLAFAMFAALEGLAVLDTDPGDTLSEHVWAFYQARPARWNLVAGFTVFLVSLFAYGLTGLVAWVWVARVALGLGLGLWLWDHFKNMGRNG